MHNLNMRPRAAGCGLRAAGRESDTPDLDHVGGIKYTSRKNVQRIESYDPGHP